MSTSTAASDRKRRGRPAIMQEPGPNADICARTTRLAKLGCTHETIAEQLSINTVTFYRWLKDYPEFCKAVKAGELDADAIVASSMYSAATGNRRVVEQPVKLKNADGSEYVEVVEVQVEDPLNVSAQIFWLKNRQRDRWKDLRAQEVSGPNGGPLELEHRHTLPARQLSIDDRDKLRAFLESNVTDVEDLNGPADDEGPEEEAT